MIMSIPVARATPRYWCLWRGILPRKGDDLSSSSMWRPPSAVRADPAATMRPCRRCRPRSWACIGSSGAWS